MAHPPPSSIEHITTTTRAQPPPPLGIILPTLSLLPVDWLFLHCHHGSYLPAPQADLPLPSPQINGGWLDMRISSFSMATKISYSHYHYCAMPSSTNKHGQYMSIQLFLRSNLWLITTVRRIQYLPDPLELPLVVNSRDMRHVRVASLIAAAYKLNAIIETIALKMSTNLMCQNFYFFSFHDIDPDMRTRSLDRTFPKERKRIDHLIFVEKKTSLIIKPVCGQRFHLWGWPHEDSIT